jgi:ParB family chromosome partitioning protein
VPSTVRRKPSLADFELAAAAVPPVDDRLVHSLSVVSIQPNPRNPRQHLDGIDELAESLRAHGLLQPVVVRRCGTGYELVAGHRRLEAAKQAGWTEIPALVRAETDDQAYILTLVENLQREDLTPKEEAAALEVLVRERGWTTRQVGEAIKRSHIYVSRRLRVFEDEILAGPVLANELPVSTAEELLRAEPEARADLVTRAIAERWGQAAARRAVLERNVPNETSGGREGTHHRQVAGADLVVAALRGEIREAWRLMHRSRAEAATHQATCDAAHIWQADSQAHDLEQRLRVLLRVRQRARQLARAAR